MATRLASIERVSRLPSLTRVLRRRVPRAPSRACRRDVSQYGGTSGGRLFCAASAGTLPEARPCEASRSAPWDIPPDDGAQGARHARAVHFKPAIVQQGAALLLVPVISIARGFVFSSRPDDELRCKFAATRPACVIPFAGLAVVG